MPDELFTDKDQGTPVVVENEDGSVKIGDTVYRTKEDAFKGKAEADKHINLTQAENKALREQVETLQQKQGDALQTLLSRLEENDTSKPNDLQRQNEDYGFQNELGEQTRVKTPDLETIQKLVDARVESTMTENDQKQQETVRTDRLKANADKVREALIKKFGTTDDAKRAWEAYKESPAYNQAVYNVQIMETPESIIEAIVGKEDINPNKANVPGSSYQQTSYSPNEVGARGWSHYKKLLKENNSSRPGGYYHPKTQMKLRADRVALGDAFMVN